MRIINGNTCDSQGSNIKKKNLFKNTVNTEFKLAIVFSCFSIYSSIPCSSYGLF